MNGNRPTPSQNTRGGVPSTAGGVTAVGGGGTVATAANHKGLDSKGQEGGPGGVDACAAGAETRAAGAGAGGDTDLLYRLPHCDGTTPPWPLDEAMEKLREVGKQGRRGGGL